MQYIDTQWYYSAVHENEIFRSIDGPRRDYAERGSLDVTYSLSSAASSSKCEYTTCRPGKDKGTRWENSRYRRNRKWMDAGAPAGEGTLQKRRGTDNNRAV